VVVVVIVDCAVPCSQMLTHDRFPFASKDIERVQIHCEWHEYTADIVPQ
jgi:hypothetical protein